KVQADGGEATSGRTLLGIENQQGLVRGYDGGWHNLVRFGIAIDTRDYEPDPNKGQMFEAIVETSNKAYGSQFNFTRYTVSEKFFYSPFEKLVDLVIAGRAAYTQAVGDVPFYSLDQFTSTERIYQGGLGGLRSLRGYKASRFMATNMALANLELRWTMFDFTVAGQRFAPIFVPFFDIGSAFDQPKDISTSVWRYAYGAGIRIAWNQATIIMVDYAMSKEDSNMFINFSHIF
ncbi:MAG TPA: BamA/TamA family outer membrane protein, partial [Turneriella sp.]|nr:BamA/TamA family outer membrane protein [Turneriella sp.]